MFDPKLLQSFITVADEGSFTDAANRLNSTQSTISQQISRLEDVLRHILLDRSARPVKLTPAGETFIGYARRILALQIEAQRLLTNPSGSRPVRVGLPDDIVTSAMSHEFAQFIERHSEIRLDVTTGLSRDLSRRFRQGEFDVVIVKEPKPQMDAVASFAEPLAWFEAAHHQNPWPQPLPLVTFPLGGLYRDDMIETLDREGLQWYLAFSGNSLSSVLRAVEAGLGISVLPVSVIGNHKIVRSSLFGDVRPMALSIYAWGQDAEIRELLEAMTHVLSVARG